MRDVKSNLWFTDYFPIPEIYLHSLDQFGNGTFLFDVSCSVSNTTPHLLALSLGCDHKAKNYRPAVVRLSSITVSSENNSTDCSCTATYQMGIHLYNTNVRKVLFADSKHLFNYLHISLAREKFTILGICNVVHLKLVFFFNLLLHITRRLYSMMWE